MSSRKGTERGQLRTAGWSAGSLSLRQLTSVQLPCRSPGAGQYLSLSPKIQEMHRHTNECARHTSLIPMHTFSQPHPCSLLRAHSFTHKSSPPTCTHTYSPLSNFQIHTVMLTQHILINTSRSYTCTHICTHTHILTLTPSSLSRFHTQLCSHILSLTHSQTPSLLHYLASPYSCMLTRVHIHTQTPHLSRRLQDQCL